MRSRRSTALCWTFDHYGRVVGLQITGAADSILAPSLLEAAERVGLDDRRHS
jgi:hypothetical protein